MAIKSITWGADGKHVTHESGGSQRTDLRKHHSESTWDGHKPRGSKDWQNFTQGDDRYKGQRLGR